MRILLIVLLFGIWSLVYGQDNAACIECHGDQTALHKSVHAEFSCKDCHTVDENHPDTMPAKVNCASCHEDTQELHELSVHGKTKTVTCTSCHGTHDVLSKSEPNSQVHHSRLASTCAACHTQEQADYQMSIHGLALKKGTAAAASCTDCHGVHDILSEENPDSKVYHAKLAYTCGNCHSRPEIIGLFGRRNLDRVGTYLNSVHGKKLHADPTANVASCSDCHGSHVIFPAINPKSKLNVLNIPETCGHCHAEIKAEYVQSIHWTSLQRGHYESPNCTDCHGEHEIEPVKNRSDLGNGKLTSTRICANCHSSETMMSRFGLDSKRLDSYMRSYHGLAVLKNSPEAATCASCHETHQIRSSIDSLSSVHASNLQTTCGKCHENITASFAKIDMHPRDQKTRNPIAHLFKNFYIWMIIVVIGGMFIHNLIILIFHIREKRKAEKYALRVQRFQPFEVYQHMLMFLSFSTLAITGFSLKFPEAGWVKLLLYLGMDEPVRSTIHRVAAVVMSAISLIQLGYFLFTPKGRKDLLSLLPNLDDVKHFWINMKYYLGLSKTRPEYGRFDYGEKAEYLALIWGVVVMGASGFVLWFPEFFIGFLPSWLFETSEVIHYYEAWLATLAIFIWHWFFVIFHPEKYPVNLTLLDGKITEEEMRHHHPKEFEQYLKNKADEGGR